jgi:hypothetical protein
VPGNLVAARCRKLTDREEIAMMWWLQQVSWREGGLWQFACDFLEANAESVPLRDINNEGYAALLDDYTPQEPNFQPAFNGAALVSYLTPFIVDPFAGTLRTTARDFPGLWELLSECRAAEIEKSTGRIVETDISRQIFEELDFTAETRSFIVIEGAEGIGKTEAARLWCKRHPGVAVYIRLECGTDEASLYRSIARAVGTPCRYARSAFDMRARIEDALQYGQLMLVIDEAHFLWPQSQSVKVPKRIDWLRTALVDFNVPIALISTPQFFSRQCDRFRKSGWNANQVERRLTRTVRLPEKLSKADAAAVTRSYFPSASKYDLARIAFAAFATVGYLTTLAHLRKRVDFMRSRQPEPTDGQLIEAALGEIVLPPGVVLPAAKPAPAKPLQAPCRGVAQPLSDAGIAPNRIGILNAQPSEVSTV